MFNPSHHATSTQRVSPPKRGAVEPVNLKTLRNPAKTAHRPFGLVRSRVHFFARISCVFKECVSHRLGRWFSSFCRNKRTNKENLISTVWRSIECSNILQITPNWIYYLSVQLCAKAIPQSATKDAQSFTKNTLIRIIVQPNLQILNSPKTKSQRPKATFFYPISATSALSSLLLPLILCPESRILLLTARFFPSCIHF
jgi:hypothetical protein